MSNNDIKDYYYILGLHKNASKDEIKTAYRKLSVKFHPDKNNGDKFFEERFKDIQEAYETLEDDAKRKIYDDELNSRSDTNTGENYYYNTHTSKNQSPQPPGSPQSKKRSRDTLFVIFGTILFLSPFIIKAIIKEINKKDNSETYNLVRYDTANHRVIDSTGTSITINRDTTTLPSNASTQTAGSGSLNTAPSNDNTQTLNYKDDDGYTAQDVVNYFLTALNNSDCTAAWNLSYNTVWVNKGKDWFCSNEAFGSVNKVAVRNINTVSQYMTAAAVYADYYAEDPYNGNKCFKQNITVQKLEYTDGKLRWKITKMTNVEPPVECYGN